MALTLYEIYIDNQHGKKVVIALSLCHYDILCVYKYIIEPELS